MVDARYYVEPMPFFTPYTSGSFVFKTVPSVECDATKFTILKLPYISGRKEWADIRNEHEDKIH